MPLYDLDLPALRDYRGDTPTPEGLGEFWSRTLAESRSAATAPTVTRVDTGVRLVETHDVAFGGFGGDRVNAWFHRPAGVTEDLPVVVSFQGYGRGRGLAHQVPLWTVAGYACLDVDTRGQGSAGAPGDTPDPVGSGPAYPGYLTRGLDSPDGYYYRRVFTDGVLAVDAARELPGVDPDRLAVAGVSQGGGIAGAVAALRTDLRAALVDVPFLTDFRRATEVTDASPYRELSTWLSVHRDRLDQAFATLSHFDLAVLGRSARTPALFSVALMDRICPPSTVYAAYNNWAGPKRIVAYPYNDHEGGQGFQEVEQLAWLAEVLPLGGD